MSEQMGNGIAGFVLYDTDDTKDFDWDEFLVRLKEDWDIDLEGEHDPNSLVFDMDGMTVAMSYQKNPIPDGEAENAARFNILWKDADKAVAKHKTHMMLAVINKLDAIEQSLLFAKVACTLLKTEGAIGIYKDPTVYEKKFYIDFAETIKDGETPMPILIYTGLYKSERGFCAFTTGLKFFGFNELEIVDSKQEADPIVRFIVTVAEYMVTENVALQDGETIGFTEEMKIPIEVSEGVSVPGTSIKLKV